LREGAILLPFIAIIVFTGLFPKPMLERIEPSIEALNERVCVEADFCPAPPPTPEEHGDEAEASTEEEQP
jgi:NADH-quinone oxidoreductase subunit M